MDWEEIATECKAAGDGSFMATVGKDGRPHVAWVGLGIGDRTLWFATNRSSQKGRNLGVNQQVALHWPEHPTRLLFGRATARLVDDPEEAAALWEAGVLPYDPTYYWPSHTDPELLFVELVPYRLSLHRGDPSQPAEVWRASA